MAVALIAMALVVLYVAVAILGGLAAGGLALGLLRLVAAEPLAGALQGEIGVAVVAIATFFEVLGIAFSRR